MLVIGASLACKAVTRDPMMAGMGSIATARGRIGFSEAAGSDRLGDGPLPGAGNGDATPIIFLHGVGSDKSVWRMQLEHFGRSRRALAFDYPGYGESAWIEGATRDDFAASIIAALDALEIRSAHVCGLSLGGVVAIAMHSAAPDRCASLIIADSFAVHPDGQAIYDRSVAASRSMTMRELAQARSGLLLGSAATPELRTEVIETMAAIDPAAYRVGAAAVWLADQRERAVAIRVPTLVLVGEEDVITPPALSEELARLIAGAEMKRIGKTGHLANAEQPIAFNEAIESFLSEQRY
jgi:3-oxoadipate enol-lactonase